MRLGNIAARLGLGRAAAQRQITPPIATAACPPRQTPEPDDHVSCEARRRDVVAEIAAIAAAQPVETRRHMLDEALRLHVYLFLHEERCAKAGIASPLHGPETTYLVHALNTWIKSHEDSELSPWRERMVADGKLPHDASPEAFLDWIENQPGPAFEVLDDLVAEHKTVCEFAGWPAPDPDALRHAVARAMRATAPPSPDVPDPEPEIKPAPKIEIAPEPARVEIRSVLVKPGQTETETQTRSAIDGRRAAVRFLEWLRVMGFTGSHLVKDLDELYMRHCEDQEIVPLALETMKRSLRKLDGVSKGSVNHRGNGRADNRSRPTVWIIAPETGPATATVLPHDVPWPDLPARSAA